MCPSLPVVANTWRGEHARQTDGKVLIDVTEKTRERKENTRESDREDFDI